MAVIKRSILIEAPVGRVYAQCLAVEDYQLFVDEVDVRPAGPSGLRWWAAEGALCPEPRAGELVVLRQEPGRLLIWAQAGDFPLQVSLAFAPVAGDATWLTCSLEVPTSLGETALAPRLARLAAWLTGTLSTLRAFIEARQSPEPRQDGSGCPA